MTALPRILALAVLAALPAAAAHAAPAKPIGTTTIELGGGALDALREQGAAIRAVRPARAGERRIVLPVAQGTLDDGAALTLRGLVVLRRGERRLALSRWRTRVRAGRTTLTAMAGGKRRTLLAAEVVPWRLSVSTTSGKVRLRATKLRLTRAGARLIRRTLGLDRLGAGVLGKLKVGATVPVEGAPGGGGPGPGGPGPGGGGPKPPVCTSGFEGGEITPAGPPLARPAGAVDVGDATIVWRPRDSFIRYVNSGEGTTASDGATAGPAEVLPGSPDALVYSFAFSLKPGSWYDAASDTAGLLADGTVRFRYSGHGIDITVKDPEIELAGGASQAIFVLGGADCTDLDDVRGEMLALTPGTPAGHDYGQIPATITATGADMFAGFYLSGDPWGSIAVAFTPTP